MAAQNTPLMHINKSDIEHPNRKKEIWDIFINIQKG